jgi:hypothetical protein
MTIGFVGIWLFSILDRSPNAAKERAAFPCAAGALGNRPGRFGRIGTLIRCQ